MISGKRNALIVGSGRSGTTWLLSMLAASEKIASAGVGELLLFEDYLLPCVRSWEMRKRGQEKGLYANSPMLFSKEELISYLHSFTELVYEKVLVKEPEAELILEKSPASSGLTGKILEIYPDMYFIHIIRDGRDVINSRLRASETWAWFFTDETIEKASKAWVSAVRGALAARDLGDHYIEVRYEDLLAEGYTTLSGIFASLGINITDEEVLSIYDEFAFDRMKNMYSGKQAGPIEKDERVPVELTLPANFFHKGKTGLWQKELRKTQWYQIHLHAGPLLLELGYVENSDWWYKSTLDRLMIPIIYRIKKFFGN